MRTDARICLFVETPALRASGYNPTLEDLAKGSDGLQPDLQKGLADQQHGLTGHVQSVTGPLPQHMHHDAEDGSFKPSLSAIAEASQDQAFSSGGTSLTKEGSPNATRTQMNGENSSLAVNHAVSAISSAHQDINVEDHLRALHGGVCTSSSGGSMSVATFLSSLLSSMKESPGTGPSAQDQASVPARGHDAGVMGIQDAHKDLASPCQPAIETSLTSVTKGMDSALEAQQIWESATANAKDASAEPQGQGAEVQLTTYLRCCLCITAKDTSKSCENSHSSSKSHSPV